MTRPSVRCAERAALAVERPELVARASRPRVRRRRSGSAPESVEQPAKVMRIGSMVKQLLDEVRAAPLDEASRDAAAGDLRDVGRRAGRGALARPAGRAAPAGAAVQRRTTSRARPSSGSPRPSSSAGWRGCSTASRPRCSPSSSPPASSSSSSASSRAGQRADPTVAGTYLRPSSVRSPRRRCRHVCGSVGLAVRRSRAAGSTCANHTLSVVHSASGSPVDTGSSDRLACTQGGMRRGRLVHPPPRRTPSTRCSTAPRGSSELVAAAAADGQPALGITDHGNMYGVLEFYKACRAPGRHAGHRHRDVHGPRAPLTSGRRGGAASTTPAATPRAARSSTTT